jgi:hypothetical protein
MSAVVLEAAPTTPPHQCVSCTRGMPADGPFLRLPTVNRFGDVWLCGHCMELVLAAHRLMSMALHERRLADLKAVAAAEAAALRDEIELREAEAARRVEEAEARAAENVAELQQQVASLEGAAREATLRAEAAERGSYTVQMLEERFARLEAIVEQNAGPADGRPKATRARRPVPEAV